REAAAPGRGPRGEAGGVGVRSSRSSPSADLPDTPRGKAPPSRGRRLALARGVSPHALAPTTDGSLAGTCVVAPHAPDLESAASPRRTKRTDQGGFAMPRTIRLALACAVLAAVCGAAATARAEAGVTVHLTANRVTKLMGRDVLAPAETARPGETLEYRAVYR